MLRVERDEHEVTGFDSSVSSHSESTLSFHDEHEFVVIRLDVDDVLGFFENIDVARNVLTVAQKCPLDRIGRSCRVRRKIMNASNTRKKYIESMRLAGA